MKLCMYAFFRDILKREGAHEAVRFGEQDVQERSEETAPKKPPKQEEPSLPKLELDGDHGLNNDQIAILRALDGKTMQVDDIIETTQIPTRQVLSSLTVLEIEGFVTQHSGKRFALAVTLA